MIFYTTKTGNLGVSLDGSATLFNHFGKHMEVGAAWKVTDATLSDLSKPCAEAVEHHRREQDKTAEALTGYDQKQVAARQRKRAVAKYKAKIAELEAELAELSRAETERLNIAELLKVEIADGFPGAMICALCGHAGIIDAKLARKMSLDSMVENDEGELVHGYCLESEEE